MIPVHVEAVKSIKNAAGNSIRTSVTSSKPESDRKEREEKEREEKEGKRKKEKDMIKISQTPMKAVYFDIDDTIYDYTSANEIAVEAVKEYCEEKLGISAGDYDDLIRQAEQMANRRIGTACAAIHNRVIRFQCMLEMLNKPVFPHATELFWLYWNTLIRAAKREEGLLELIKELKEKGIYIGFCTNMTAEIQYRKLEKLELGMWLDGIVTSEETGTEKPDAKLFLLCAQKAGVKPEECAFIGDCFEHDLEGACAVGMHGIWYRKAGPNMQADEQQTDEQQKAERLNIPVMRHFSECMELLEKI